MLKNFKRHFFAGLVIFIPLSLTIYFLHLFFLMMSEWMHVVLLHQHVVLIHPALVRPVSLRLVGWRESGIRHIPVFRGMYEAIQKMTEAFFGTSSPYQAVVLVEYPRKGIHTESATRRSSIEKGNA